MTVITESENIDLNSFENRSGVSNTYIIYVYYLELHG